MTKRKGELTALMQYTLLLPNVTQSQTGLMTSLARMAQSRVQSSKTATNRLPFTAPIRGQAISRWRTPALVEVGIAP